jgi:hypothetical protein
MSAAVRERDPAYRLAVELSDKDVLLSQLRDLCADDPQLLADSIEGETDLPGLIDAVVNSISEKDVIIHGTAEALRKLRDRKARAEKHKERLETLLAVTLENMGVKKHICGDGSTLSLTRVAPTAKVVDEVMVPTDWFIKQPDKINQDALTKYVRAKLKALADAEKLHGEARIARVREINAEFPDIPGVTASNGGFSLRRT